MTWGLKTIIIKIICLIVIEKILYACGIWFNEKEKLKLKILQLQQSALLTITKCYRTVSTETMCPIWLPSSLLTFEEEK